MPDVSSFHGLQSEGEYRAALQAVRRYFESEPAADTPEAAQFDALVQLIDQFEETHYRVSPTAAAFERRIARKVEDLDGETLRAIAKSDVPSEFDHLDALLKDWKP